MRRIYTEIEIDVPPAEVWAVLADLERYGEWNPHVTRAEGDLREGATLDLRVNREGADEREMSVTVTAVEPGRRLEWVGRVLHRTLFEARHSIELEPLDGDRTRLVNAEQLAGVLVGWVVTDEPECDYEAMNRALKERVEAASPAGGAETASASGAGAD